MSLAMTAPTKHPKSGVYRIRITVPIELRGATERLYGIKREFTETLGTKDHKHARQLAPSVIERIQGKLRAAAAAHGGHQVSLTDRQVSALCGKWLAQQEALAEHHIPEDVEVYQERTDFLTDCLENFERPDDTLSMTGDARTFLAEDVEWLLTTEYLPADAESRDRLVRRLCSVANEHYRAMIRRHRSGTWDTPRKSTDFPTMPGAKPSSDRATFDVLLSGWALDRGLRVDAKPVPRALYDRQRTIERLATFLGHRDASKVSKADAVRWKAEMQGRDLHAATVRNDLSEMSAVWKWGVANGMVVENPFAGILPKKATKQGTVVRGFTDAEATAILEAAKQSSGYLRWVPWVLCATGARLNEIAQASKGDVFMVDGVHVIRIHDDGEGRSVKNEDSRRTIPLHPTLIAEGFLGYVDSLKPGSDLWPDMAKDKQFGLRSGTGGRRVRWWLREKLKITDPRIHANHSWRHWFMDAARRAMIPQEVRSALTGHSAQVDESANYGAGMRSLIVLLAEAVEKIKLPHLEEHQPETSPE